jgi:hypothetical protein
LIVAMLLACHAAAPAPEAADVSFTPDPGEAVIVLRGEAGGYVSGDTVDLIATNDGRSHLVVRDARVVRRDPGTASNMLLAVQVSEEQAEWVERELENPGTTIFAGRWQDPPLWDAVDRRTPAERHGLKRPR